MASKEAETKRVGVFMKVYRNEDTMHQAIQSVMGQSYQNIKFYVLVNEITKPILQKYALKDTRVELIVGAPIDNIQTYLYKIAQENYYVTTIDADDWYHEKYIEELLLYAERENADIVACGNYYCVNKDNIVGERKQGLISWDVHETNRVLPYIYGHFRTIWGKLIASNVLMKSKFEELPKNDQIGSYGGDTLFMFLLFLNAERLCVCDKTLYFYRMSETGNTYKLMKGRLDADQIVFEFVENILHNLGPMGDNQRRYLLWIYGNALFDTINLLLCTELSGAERVDKLLYLFEKQLTKELFLREKNGLLDISELGKHENYADKIYQQIFIREDQVEQRVQYLQILETIYPGIYGKISPEEFKILLKSKQLLNSFVKERNEQLIEMLLTVIPTMSESDKEICVTLIKKITSNSLMKTVLQSNGFIDGYQHELKLLNKGQYTELCGILMELFSKEVMPNNAEVLVKLWINVAAIVENVSQFILAKQLEVEILLQRGNKKEALNAFEELVELGISDGNMDYLKEKLGK